MDLASTIFVKAGSRVASFEVVLLDIKVPRRQAIGSLRREGGETAVACMDWRRGRKERNELLTIVECDHGDQRNEGKDGRRVEHVIYSSSLRFIYELFGVVNEEAEEACNRQGVCTTAAVHCLRVL